MNPLSSSGKNVENSMKFLDYTILSAYLFDDVGAISIHF